MRPVFLLFLILISGCVAFEEEKAQEEVEITEEGEVVPEQLLEEDRYDAGEETLELYPSEPELKSTLLWSFSTGEPVYDIDIEDNFIALASYDNSFYLLSPEGELIHKFKTRGNAEAVALNSEEKLLLGASFVYPETTLYLYSLGEKPELLWKKSFDSQVKALDFQGENIIVGEVSGRVSAFSPSGEKLWEFLLGRSAWGVAEIEAGGKAVAVAGDDSNLYLLSPQGKLIWKRFQGRKGYLYGCALEENLGLIGTASQDSLAALYSDEGKLLWKFKTNFSNSDIAISREGFVAVASWDGNVYILSRDGGLLLAIPVKEPTALDFSGDYFGIASRDGNAYLYKLERGE